MKRLFWVIAILASLNLCARAAKLAENQLPPPVQKTLGIYKGPDSIKRIERKTEKGRMVYKIELSGGGFNPRLVIAEDGTLLKPREKVTLRERMERATPLVSVNEPPRVATLRMDRVSAVVRRTIEREQKGLEIARISKDQRNDRFLYYVEFKRPDGNIELQIAEDGSIVK
jgi:hypothetical protein